MKPFTIQEIKNAGALSKNNVPSALRDKLGAYERDEYMKGVLQAQPTKIREHICVSAETPSRYTAIMYDTDVEHFIAFVQNILKSAYTAGMNQKPYKMHFTGSQLVSGTHY